MISNAIGRPMPNAPPITDANAESKFALVSNSRTDMPWLH